MGCNTCNATEHVFHFTLYRISFCDATFQYPVQCEHSLSNVGFVSKEIREFVFAELAAVDGFELCMGRKSGEATSAVR